MWFFVFLLFPTIDKNRILFLTFFVMLDALDPETIIFQKKNVVLNIYAA